MYIEIKDLFFGIIGIVATVALVYLIIALNNISRLAITINNTLKTNKNNIDIFCNNLPKISDNITNISENINGVSEVVTEATAEVIVAKDNIVGNVEMLKEILNIIASVFLKK